MSNNNNYNCSVRPLVLPIQNNTLRDGVALNRGIFCQLGDQPEGFRMTFTLSVPSIRNSLDCTLYGNATSEAACIGASGGTYNPTAGTFQSAPPGTFNETINSNPVGATVIDGYDTATLYGGLQIPRFPFRVWSNPQASNKSVMALGPDSPVFEALRNIDAIPSRVMGIFMGSRSESQPADGSLVIGGYDRARVSSSFTNFTMNAGDLQIPCSLQVRIKDIRLQNLNGTSSNSLMSDSGSTVAACIDPLQNQFTITRAMYARWAAFTQHPPIDTNSTGTGNDPTTNYQLFPWESEPLIGNLTITLDNGYTTTIPHYELVSQQRGTDAEGGYAVINSSVLMSQVGTGETDYGDDVPLLGGVFLAMNYLLVDFDTQSFALAPAVITATAPASDIVTMCSSTASDAGSGSGGKSPGVIAGSVVTGVALISIIVITLVLYIRRRPLTLWKSSRNASADTELPELPNPTNPPENSNSPPTNPEQCRSQTSKNIAADSLLDSPSELPNATRTVELPSPDSQAMA